MTHQMQSNELSEAVQLLADNGFEGMANAMQILLNEAMRLERSEYIGAEPYEQRNNAARIPMDSRTRPSIPDWASSH